MCLFNASKDRNGDLKLECLMPSMELATVGGGTSLSAQRGCLSITGAASSSDLAKVCISSVMAGELSLLAAQCAGHLASAHANLGRAGPAQAHNSTEGAPSATEAKLKAEVAASTGASTNNRGIHTAAFNMPKLPVP